ncbi:MAG: helix-turn-helix transcriptional regulator [Azonexus sp.]|nr:helix-turn-helix transcriptional regulator [Betaproteobacteria bacterium]MBK8917080.1 helix-turn-helix transcriptional regulator [Betaproteobacteria bacterium]MBP6037126.1 helix-turn-helix transcriptional regulator [Azonexus sp.]MBP6907669.1 helix-turn-helix transcriptional regulator [Azonexus sp.]
MGVHLNYRFEPGSAAIPGEEGLQLENPLFRILAAVREGGSISCAAKTLGLSYRYVWGFLKEQETALGRPLLAGRAGQSARLSEFGERLVWAERRAHARLMPRAEELAAQLDNELLLAVKPELRPLLVSTSHDLLFSALRDRVRQRAEVLLEFEYLGSAKALDRLNRGECALAGVHMPLNDLHLCQRGSVVHSRIGRRLKLGDHKLIRFATRSQGFMVSRGNPLGIRSVGDLRRPGVHFVNRQAGSGTRVLFDEFLVQHGVPGMAIEGYGDVETTHLAVAACVAAGVANCGFGLKAAAARFGLGFVPMVDEQFFLVCHKPVLDSAPLQAILEVLRSAEFRSLAATVPGYAADEAGQIISLRRTLPWYK